LDTPADRPPDAAAVSAPAAGSGGKVTLSRDLADLLIELSIAIHKHAMYPEGHPSLAPAAEGVMKRLEDLLATHSQLALGVARNQLVIEGVATDSRNPVLTDLANRLHAHQLGAISFLRGVTAFEVQNFLRLVATDAHRSGDPLGLQPSARRNVIPHVRMYPVAYDRLQLVEDEASDAPDTREQRAARTRAAQLWVGLARAAMALEELDEDEDADDTQVDPSLVARAISEHQRGEAYDQVIVGYLLQIADELKTAGGADALQLKQRMTQLVSHLEPKTLEKLLEMGGDNSQRRRFMMDAAEGMTVDAVIKLVHAAAQAQGQTVSHSLLRILEKLAHHAEAGGGTRAGVADQSVRDHVSELISEWSLTDPNPDSYTLALQQMARSSPMFRVSAESAFKPDSQRIVQMALEVGVAGPAVLNAAQDLVEHRQFPWLKQLIEDADVPEVTGVIWRELATVERLQEVLETDPLDAEMLDGLIPKLGTAAAEPMIEALIESESRQKRRILIDRLIELGSMVAPLAIARLADSRWYVQRNMLAIIGGLPEIPAGFGADDFFRHPDQRVRREAYRIMFDHPELRERAISRSVSDPDPQNARMGLAAALEGCPRTAIPLVVTRATDREQPSEVREAAIRVLGRIDDGSVREVLLGIVQPRRTLLRTRLPAKTPEYLAALRAIQRFRGDRRVDAALRAAAASRDPEIIEATRAPVNPRHERT